MRITQNGDEIRIQSCQIREESTLFIDTMGKLWPLDENNMDG